jgi:hypothetical protein
MMRCEAATLIGRSPATQRRTRRGERLMRRASADCQRETAQKDCQRLEVSQQKARPISQNA